MARAARGANGTWSVTHVLSEHDVRCLATDPLHAHIVYAGTQGQGILCSEDQGHSWHPAGLGDHIVKSLAVSRVDPGVIYAGTKPSMIFVSRDNGTSWTELDSFRSIRSRRFWFSPAEPPFTA